MAQAFGEDVKQFIDRELDLKEVINAAREIQGWTVQEAAVAERRYRDFLWACWNVVNNKVPDIGSLSRFAAFSRSVERCLARAHSLDREVPRGLRPCI